MLINSKISKWFFHKYFGIPKEVEIFKIGKNSVHYWKDKNKNEAIVNGKVKVYQLWESKSVPPL